MDRTARIVAIAAVVLAAVTTAAPAHAQSQNSGPSDSSLIVVGSVAAIPTYFVGVTLHEGSHAVTAELLGAHVTSFHIMPGRYPPGGPFFFGYTAYRGRLSRTQETLFLLAPKFLDLALLGGYASLVGIGSLPQNRWGQLALVELATGSWVDLSKDIPSLQPLNDVNKVYALYHRDSFWQQLPFRLLHVAVSAGAGYFVVRGYIHLFSDRGAQAATALVVPVVTGAF